MNNKNGANHKSNKLAKQLEGEREKYYDGGYEIVGQIESNFLAKKNGKYGILDSRCTTIVPCEYDEIVNPSSSIEENVEVFIVRKDNKYGMISKRGKVRIDCKYYKVDYFTSRLVVVYENEKSCRIYTDSGVPNLNLYKEYICVTQSIITNFENDEISFYAEYDEGADVIDENGEIINKDEALICPNCDSELKRHKDDTLVCPYCGYVLEIIE